MLNNYLTKSEFNEAISRFSSCLGASEVSPIVTRCIDNMKMLLDEKKEIKYGPSPLVVCRECNYRKDTEELLELIKEAKSAIQYGEFLDYEQKINWLSKASKVLEGEKENIIDRDTMFGEQLEREKGL